MLSTLGLDSKGAGRNNHGGSRLLPNVPRGFSVHVFKNPTLPTHSLPPMPPAVVIPSKYDTRPSNGGGQQWNRQQSLHAPHSDSERKQLQAAPPLSSQDHRLIHVPTANQAWPVETKPSKSSKSYGIYPSLVGDVYVYERSISSVSFDDELASSPSSESSSSSDSDLYDDRDRNNNTATYPGNFNVEISSTRASSSTETLESTLTARAAPGARLPNVASSLPPAPPLPAIAAPPRPASTRPQQPHSDRDSATVARSAAPLTRTESRVQRSISISHAASVPPIQLDSVPLDQASDSDSETVISETHGNDMVVDMLGAQWAAPTSYSSYPSRSTTPSRRDSDDRVSSGMHRRDAPPPAVRDVPATRPGAYREDSANSLRGDEPRAPPGLSGAVATPPDGRPRSPPRRDAGPLSSSATNISPSSRSPPSAPPLARTPSSRQSPPGAPARNGEMGSSSYFPPPPPHQQPSSSSSPPRREVRAPSPQHNTPPTSFPPSAGQTPSPQGSPTAPRNMNALVVAAVTKRNVRWTENLVCPSPVPPESRRKGWYNRRGDQLWTNDGQYKMPEPGTEYPPDLAYYPEPNQGWMNEDGVRIDMQHRLIPKQPLRSALKRAKPLNA
ncbi:hypothetical protein K466DRAFT_661718 [Polyporus arcularius HHB13444]|uniref:Uncharacterized protein n=1 Tax=Polyporus arcularius HHB13444 TaxID=1314778 RepID=A0A5C3PJ12_9APHY|nr:hypothetical protein K466DRAFT_661718 [Polyporus arcularius HHB13444]